MSKTTCVCHALLTCFMVFCLSLSYAEENAADPIQEIIDAGWRSLIDDNPMEATKKFQEALASEGRTTTHLYGCHLGGASVAAYLSITEDQKEKEVFSEQVFDLGKQFEKLDRGLAMMYKFQVDGMEALVAGDSEKAISLFSESMEKGNSSPYIFFLIARALLAMGPQKDIDLALAAYKKIDEELLPGSKRVEDMIKLLEENKDESPMACFDLPEINIPVFSKESPKISLMTTRQVKSFVLCIFGVAGGIYHDAYGITTRTERVLTELTGVVHKSEGTCYLVKAHATLRRNKTEHRINADIWIRLYGESNPLK